MKSSIEQYVRLPESVCLPGGIRSGLESLGERSAITQTEWVGAITFSPDQYKVIPLGHQAKGMVTVPVINLGHIAKRQHRKIDEEFILEQCVTSQWDITNIPNKDGIRYRGAIIFLLPRDIIPNFNNLFLSTLSPENQVIPEDEFLGLSHSHIYTDSLSHLPSLHDVRHFVFGPNLFESVISGNNTSLLIKSKDSVHFESHPESSDYLNKQEMIDDIMLEEGHTFTEILLENCSHYKIGVYSGKLNSEDPLFRFPEITLMDS